MGWTEKVVRRGVWTGKWKAVAWDPAGRRRCGSKVFEDFEAADEWWKRRERGCDESRESISGVPVQRQRRRTKFDEFAWLWYTALERTPNTRRVKAAHIRAWVVALGGEDVMLDEITATAVSAHLIRLRDVAGVQNATRAAHLGTLRQILAAAVRDGHIPTDPTAAVETPDASGDKDSHIARILSDEDMLLAASQTTGDEGWSAQVLLAYDSGLRVGEVAAVRRDFLDLGPKPRIYVAESIGPDGPGPPKGKKKLWVPLSPRTVTALRAYLQLHPKLGQARLFSRDPRGIRESWRTACVAAGLVDPRPRFHDLRHAFVMNLVWAGVHPRVVQRLARHELLTTTQGYFDSVAMGEMEDALEQVWQRHRPTG